MDVLARVLASDEYLFVLGGMVLGGVLCRTVSRFRRPRPLSRREIERLQSEVPMPTAGAEEPLAAPAVPQPRPAHFEDGTGRTDSVAGAARQAPATPRREVP